MNRSELERLWATRPVRPDAGRTVAGVCAGFGARYRVDPTLVKVAFVVATLFGGSGLLLYLVAWIALPGQHGVASTTYRDTDDRGRRRRHGRDHHRHPGKMIFGVVLAIIVISSISHSQAWGSGGIVGAALMLLGWWLLYRRTPEPPAGTAADAPEPREFGRWIPRAAYRTPATASAGAPTGTASAPAAPTTVGDTPVVTVDEPTPPAWDPLGTARFAWDLPEPPDATPPTSPDPRRSPLTMIVIGVSIIVAAVGAGARYAGVDWFTPGRIASLSLIVVAAGLIHASMRRRTGEHHTGLVPIAVALSVVVVVTSLVNGIGSIPSGGAGQRTFTPATAADIKPDYSLSVGSLDLDLRQVTLEKDQAVTVQNGMGEIKIHIPETMNVRADCRADVGDLTCPDGLSGGSDGTAGPVLTIDAHTGVGKVEVIR